jgi:exodeoxyribonuclease VII small subunit
VNEDIAAAIALPGDGPPEELPPDRHSHESAVPQTYESASARVEEIIRRLDSGEASLQETLELVREGKGLIELCAAELQEVAGALEELRLDELIESLEGEGHPEPRVTDARPGRGARG